MPLPPPVRLAQIALMTIAGLLPWISPARAADAHVVRGQAAYRERMALPDGASFEASLEDVSRADAPAVTLGTARVENVHTVPIPFEIPYDPARIDGRNSYSVRARILVDGRLFFITDEIAPVLTQGHGNEVSLLLVRAAGEPAPPARGTTRGKLRGLRLDGPRWELVELEGKPLPTGLTDTPRLEFAPDPRRVTGSGGCNLLSGEYERDGERLSFKPLASTRRACPDGMDTETAFHAALAKVRSFRIAGRQLELLDEAGGRLALLKAPRAKARRTR